MPLPDGRRFPRNLLRTARRPEITVTGAPTGGTYWLIVQSIPELPKYQPPWVERLLVQGSKPWTPIDPAVEPSGFVTVGTVSPAGSGK